MTIVLWCIFITATLPYVPFSYVKGLDPIQPRHHVGDLAERSPRAYGAHLNGLETFPVVRSGCDRLPHGRRSKPDRRHPCCPRYSGSDWPHDGLHRRRSASAHCCLRHRAVGRARNLHHAAVSLKTDCEWAQGPSCCSHGAGEFPRRLALGDGISRVEPMTIGAVPLPRGAPLHSAPPWMTRQRFLSPQVSERESPTVFGPSKAWTGATAISFRSLAVGFRIMI